jgi:hypothetical protein
MEQSKSGWRLFKQDPRVNRVPRANRVLRVNRVPRVILAQLDLKDHKERLDPKVNKVFKVSKV